MDPLLGIVLAAEAMDWLLGIVLAVAAFVVGSIVRDLLERSERRRGKVKTCPDCAAVVGRHADICRVCGYRFPSDRPRGGGVGLPF